MTTLYGTTNLGIAMNGDVSRVRLFDGPLELSWHHCATTSDFIADLFAFQFKSSRNDYNEVRHSVGYLANELIENAVKFREQGEILIESSMDSENFIIKVSNFVNEGAATKFQKLLSEITVGDPGDLLIRRIEANAEDPEMTGSGLGLLTLMSDYDARFAWIFSEVTEARHVYLEIFASIPIRHTH